MCNYNDTTKVLVKISADLSCDGVEKWKEAQIDSCISNIVKALQSGSINMRGSCCGHKKGFGYIDLQDGRSLVILNQKQNDQILSGKKKLVLF